HDRDARRRRRPLRRGLRADDRRQDEGEGHARRRETHEGPCQRPGHSGEDALAETTPGHPREQQRADEQERRDALIDRRARAIGESSVGSDLHVCPSAETSRRWRGLVEVDAGYSSTTVAFTPSGPWIAVPLGSYVARMR